jgi:hypothetical protein
LHKAIASGPPGRGAGELKKVFASFFKKKTLRSFLKKEPKNF